MAFLLEKGVGPEEIQDFPATGQKTSFTGSADLSPAAKVQIVNSGRPSGETDQLSASEKVKKAPVRPSAAKKTAAKTAGESQASHYDAEPGTMYAYVDGSFRQGYSVYGYGVVIVSSGEVIKTISGFGSRPEYVSMRNVAGEVLGAVKAMEYALESGAQKLVLYFDYQGIESWATGAWKRNNDLTKGYFEFVRSIRDRLRLSFEKVKGHSGDEFNEMADELAKAAVISSEL